MPFLGQSLTFHINALNIIAEIADLVKQSLAIWHCYNSASVLLISFEYQTQRIMSQVTTTTLTTNNDNDPFESTGSEDKKEVFITE